MLAYIKIYFKYIDIAYLDKIDWWYFDVVPDIFNMLGTFCKIATTRLSSTCYIMV